ncbi:MULTISPECIES: hypothetical protein [Bacillus]|uniref:hypothetical protein n=1 Tax=Bacillus TaxID=1386 RepID=UPI000BB91902|nr:MULTISPECIES: hypothetical protein [Bacillus]
MKKDDDKKVTEGKKNKSGLFWDLFITGGFFTFEKEWKNSKSLWHTLLMFLVPILLTGIIVLLAMVASKTYN